MNAYNVTCDVVTADADNAIPCPECDTTNQWTRIVTDTCEFTTCDACGYYEYESVTR